MTEENPSNPPAKPEGDEPPALNLEEVVEVEPDDLTDEQKNFLEEKKADLTPEQAEKFGIKQEEEEEEEVDPAKVKVATRFKTPKKPKGAKAEEDEIDPQDEATISRIVDKKTAGVIKAVQQQADVAEVNALIQVRPEFNKYRAVILKHMAHPAYKNIPAHRIAVMVAADDLQKLGAQKEREAAKKAADTHQPGSTAREPGKGKVDWKKASKEDFQAQRAKVLGQQG